VEDNEKGAEGEVVVDLVGSKEVDEVDVAADGSVGESSQRKICRERAKSLSIRLAAKEVERCRRE
jgi:hypothetical protein